MKIRQIMSAPVISVTSDTSVYQAAMLMRDHDIGLLPIVSDTHPVGVVTDRDIVTRDLSVVGAACEITVAQIMSDHPAICRVDQDVVEATAIMGDNQVYRLLVVDRDDELVGILSLGDIAKNVSEELAGQALGEIVETR